VAVPNNPSQAKAQAAVSTASVSSQSDLPTIASQKDQGAATPPHSDEKVFNVSASTASTQSPKNVDWEYDVYATPFVPQEWQAINSEPPGSIIATKNWHRINNSRYTATFTGTALLPNRPAILQEDVRRYYPSCNLTAQSYLRYFMKLWQLELVAKERENVGYRLYRVPLNPPYASNNELLWGLSVPGLREDNPLLEMGDVLQIRQLWVDGAGNIIHVPMEVEDPGFGHILYDYKPWTGIQYEACVYSINRAQELVYLKAEGLTHLIAGQASVPMAVNVSFPMKHTLLNAQRRALAYVDQELGKSVSGLLGHDLLTSAGDDFDDFHGSLETMDKSGRISEPNGRIIHNDWIRRVLFPLEEDGRLQTSLRMIPHRPLFDPAINFEQAHAVNSICVNDYGMLPYLISGPPGTGKTKTLVETAMQLLNSNEVAHILICAPSEAAADTLALRLKHYLNNKQLFRLNRPGRADNEVPRGLTQYCYMENDMFYLPPFKKLMSFNVVIASCQDATLLAEARLTNNDLWEIERNMFTSFHPEDQAPVPTLHWGALLIDEAAQATEIDVLPAISVVCPPSAYPMGNPQPRFVMAGDEHQLGPRTASRDPQFSNSLFARLFERPLYTAHPLSRSNMKPSSGPPVLKKSMLPIIYPPFANLIRNYRSHPAILSVPSSLFYNDTLIPEAATPNTRLQASSLWRGRKWPVLFFPHKANDEIERDGGGWYNVSEAKLACSVAQTLVEVARVKQADICIMSPFAAQVKLLRRFIRSNAYGGGSGLWDVNIGPLEAFQGLEKRVVVICTTRTRSRFLGEDAKRGLGIVGQKRKMNVALTRAKEALFVIGNPEVLGQDEHWRHWLAFCWRNGLVMDPGKVWDGDLENVGEAKVGVLERALVAKEDHGSVREGKLLGAAATSLDMERDYELWVESLRAALDEEIEEAEDGLEDGEEDGLEGSAAENSDEVEHSE
tara:strand:- start:1154 stop:4021 length:2868 start_codon:yes stop_codon:yes gene_type:complete